MLRSLSPILRSQDFLAGLMFTAIGLLGLYLSLQHPLGTAARMEPGFFPALVTGGLALIGIAIMVRAAIAVSPPFEAIEWRPFLFVIGATVFFGLAADRIGLLLSVVGLIVLSHLAEAPFRTREVALLALGMSALSIAVFHYGLGLPFRILP